MGRPPGSLRLAKDRRRKRILDALGAEGLRLNAIGKAARATRPTVLGDLRELIAKGLVRFEPPGGPGRHGKYVSVRHEDAQMLGRLLWAENVQRSIGLPGPELTGQEYEAAMQALRWKRELPPITEIFDRMHVKRPSINPKTVNPRGNVGASPEKAEELLGEIGLERSPLVRELRGR